MELVGVLLADAANVSDTGKLNLLGVFQTVTTASVPCKVSMALVIMMRASPMDRGTSQQIRVELLDADGRQLSCLDGMICRVPDVPDVLTPDVNLIVNLQQFQFNAFGAYSFHVHTSGQYLGSVALNIIPPRLPPPGGPE